VYQIFKNQAMYLRIGWTLTEKAGNSTEQSFAEIQLKRPNEKNNASTTAA